jgi:hypothetical protein
LIYYCRGNVINLTTRSWGCCSSRIRAAHKSEMRNSYNLVVKLMTLRANEPAAQRRHASRGQVYPFVSALLPIFTIGYTLVDARTLSSLLLDHSSRFKPS